MSHSEILTSLRGFPQPSDPVVVAKAQKTAANVQKLQRTFCGKSFECHFCTLMVVITWLVLTHTIFSQGLRTGCFRVALLKEIQIEKQLDSKIKGTSKIQVSSPEAVQFEVCM